MNDLKTYIPLLFPVFFVCFWLLVTTLLGLISGWYVLMQKYPNRLETPVLQLNNQSGMLGCVSMGRILKIATCPSGLRIGIMKIFGVFSRDIFVPWAEIRVIRKDRFFWQSAQLQFGNLGSLSIMGNVADRLARSAEGQWPEPGPFPEETKKQAFIGVVKLWFLYTSIAALFFTFAPRLALLVPTSNGGYPPVSVAILFPAIVFGFASLLSYFQRVKK